MCGWEHALFFTMIIRPVMIKTPETNVKENEVINKDKTLEKESKESKESEATEEGYTKDYLVSIISDMKLGAALPWNMWKGGFRVAKSDKTNSLIGFLPFQFGHPDSYDRTYVDKEPLSTKDLLIKLNDKWVALDDNDPIQYFESKWDKQKCGWIEMTDFKCKADYHVKNNGNNNNNDNQQIQCKCGELMIKINGKEAYPNAPSGMGIQCDICATFFPAAEAIVYHCPKEQDAKQHPRGYDICQKCVANTPNVYPYWQNFLFYGSEKLWRKGLFDYLYKTATRPTGSEPMNSSVISMKEVEKMQKMQGKNNENDSKSMDRDEDTQNILDYLEQIKIDTATNTDKDMDNNVARPKNLYWNVAFPVWFQRDSGWIDNKWNF